MKTLEFPPHVTAMNRHAAAVLFRICDMFIITKLEPSNLK